MASKVQVKKAMAELIYNHKKDILNSKGQVSPTQVVGILYDRYGIKVTRQTVASYLKEGIEDYRKVIAIADNDTIVDIIEAMKIQKEIWNDNSETSSARTKAATAWKGLNDQKIKYEKQLMDERISQAEVNKPNHLVKIEPPEIKVACPKCKHEFFLNEKKEKKSKKFKLERGNGQSTFDKFEDKKNGKDE